MKRHGRTMARLHRARHIAESEGRDELVEKIDSLITKEKNRHQAKMKKHEDKIK